MYVVTPLVGLLLKLCAFVNKLRVPHLMLQDHMVQWKKMIDLMELLNLSVTLHLEIQLDLLGGMSLIRLLIQPLF